MGSYTLPYRYGLVYPCVYCCCHACESAWFVAVDASVGVLPANHKAMQTLNKKLSDTRKEQQRSRWAAHRTSQQAERSTKNFYQPYKSKTNNTDIASLYITPEWDTPETKQIEITGEQATTTDPEGIVEELTSYYSHLFQEKPSTDNKIFLDLLRKRGITKKQKDHLEKDITILEV